MQIGRRWHYLLRPAEKWSMKKNISIWQFFGSWEKRLKICQTKAPPNLENRDAFWPFYFFGMDGEAGIFFIWKPNGIFLPSICTGNQAGRVSNELWGLWACSVLLHPLIPTQLVKSVFIGLLPLALAMRCSLPGASAATVSSSNSWDKTGCNRIVDTDIINAPSIAMKGVGGCCGAQKWESHIFLRKNCSPLFNNFPSKPIVNAFPLPAIINPMQWAGNFLLKRIIIEYFKSRLANLSMTTHIPKCKINKNIKIMPILNVCLPIERLRENLFLRIDPSLVKTLKIVFHTQNGVERVANIGEVNQRLFSIVIIIKMIIIIRLRIRS